MPKPSVKTRNSKSAPARRSASPLLIREPVLFLDIDGVLNGHTFHKVAQSCTIHPACVQALNYVIERADPKIVLSSAWRYIIHGRAMSLMGFEYLLRTHGCGPMIRRIIACTIPDEVCAHCNFKHARGSQKLSPLGEYICNACGKTSSRGQQITHWLDRNNVQRYAVVDDGDLGITAAGHPFLLTRGDVGLTLPNAKRLVGLLRRLSARKS